MNEKNFVLNFDHISEGRTEEHPERGQLIVKGKVIAHKNGGADDPVQSCLVLAIEKAHLKNFAKYVDPKFEGSVNVVSYDTLSLFDESGTLDPNNIYAALVVESVVV